MGASRTPDHRQLSANRRDQTFSGDAERLDSEQLLQSLMIKAMIDYAGSQGFEALLNAYSEACKQAYAPDVGDSPSYADANGNVGTTKGELHV